MKRIMVIIIGGVIIVAVVVTLLMRLTTTKGKGAKSSFSSRTERSVQDQVLPDKTAPDLLPRPSSQARPKHIARPVGDQDKDGLFDEDERKHGTDSTKADTDDDGLSDFDELIIYSTDPKKADTDGDTFSDKDEIRGGYDPRSKAPTQLP